MNQGNNEPQMQSGRQPVPGQPGAQVNQPPVWPPLQPSASPYPQAPMQPPQVPPKIHVHHSYIWLGSLRVFVTLIFAFFIAIVTSVGGILSEGDALDSIGMGDLAIIVGVIAGSLLVAAAIIVVYQWLSYKHLFYELEPEEFNLYQGILNKRRSHVPYQRIQSVDQKASLLQRIFGVCTVTIDTAGGSTNKAITIPYLTKQQAELLRTELFARKQYLLGNVQPAQQPGGQPLPQPGYPPIPVGYAPNQPVNGPFPGVQPGQPMPQAGVQPGQPLQQPGYPQSAPPQPAGGNVLDAPAGLWDQFNGVFGGQSMDTGMVTYEYGLTNRELILTGVSNSATFAVIVATVLGAILQAALFLFDLFPLESMAMFEGIATIPSSPLFSTLATAVIVGVVGMVIFIWAISALGSCLLYGGFHARRRGSRIEVEHGLLQHQFQGIDIDRIQSVTIRQSFIRRLIGYCEIVVGRVNAAASSEDSKSQNTVDRGVVVHPFVKMNRVPEIMAGLLPEYADVPKEAIPVASVALRRAVVRRGIWQGAGFWIAICTLITQVVFTLSISGVLFPGQPVPSDLLAALIATGQDRDLIEVWTILSIAFPVCYVVAAVICALEIVGAVLWARGSSFAFNRRFMQVSNAGFGRETVSFPRVKIQYGYTRTNPLQRMAKTATIQARIAAGVGGTTLRLIDVREEDANRWLAWLEPRGNRMMQTEKSVRPPIPSGVSSEISSGQSSSMGGSAARREPAEGTIGRSDEHGQQR